MGQLEAILGHLRAMLTSQSQVRGCVFGILRDVSHSGSRRLGLKHVTSCNLTMRASLTDFTYPTAAILSDLPVETCAKAAAMKHSLHVFMHWLFIVLTNTNLHIFLRCMLLSATNHEGWNNASHLHIGWLWIEASLVRQGLASNARTASDVM